MKTFGFSEKKSVNFKWSLTQQDVKTNPKAPHGVHDQHKMNRVHLWNIASFRGFASVVPGYKVAFILFQVTK